MISKLTELPRRCCAVILLFTIAACASGGASPTNYYLLNPVKTTESNQQSGMVIEILDLHLPQYLERFQIATRSSDNQLDFSDTQQWAENLRKNLMRVSSQNLSEQLGIVDIGTPIRRTSSPANYRVQVYIETFELQPDGRVRLNARWQLTQADNDNTLTTKRFSSAGNLVSTADYGEIVDSMSQLYADMCQEIADELRDLHGGQTN